MKNNPINNKQLGHVMVALSGGVDSSVSAYLLKKQGYQVSALFMKNWEEDDTSTYCHAEEDLLVVENICEHLQIPLHTVNFAAEYWDNVFEYFLAEYAAGRTPNPDILCNREIKFKACLQHALKLGADYFATGHYVGKRYNPTSKDFSLIKGLDSNKDQSYFLYAISQSALEKSLFPLADIPKPQVREIAKQQGLINYQKKDSTGICFIGERNFKTFLQRYLPAQPGLIKTLTGETIGEHEGLMYYTLGQRQGLQIGGYKLGSGEPWYVARKDLTDNVLYVVQGSDHPALFSQSLITGPVHWINQPSTQNNLSCTAKVRYRQTDQKATLSPLGNGCVKVMFNEPQRSVTPGQSIVMYQDNVCLGGGIIEQIE